MTSTNERLPAHETLAQLPPQWTHDLMPAIRTAITERSDKVVILDDDPTGTQTVHDVTVLTEWSVDTLCKELENPSPAVFVLTNSRSMTAAAATKLNQEIATNLKAASAKTGRSFVIISRSDSTLRGHFPTETDALKETLEADVDAVLIIPAFMAGKRYTINGVHYVGEGDWLIPAAATPFAQDAAFGYRASDLREWVAEKTGGNVAADDVAAISLMDIRTGGADAVASQLMPLEDNMYCVFDAITERDLEVIVAGILKAEANGKRFLYRTAASFAAIRAGISLRAVLTPGELKTGTTGGGLVVVGSYVPKSSDQLAHLLDSDIVRAIEIDVSQLLSDETQQTEIDRVSVAIDKQLAKDETVVIYTSRKLITGHDADSSLAIGNRVSDSLVRIVRGIQSNPRFIIAKGGITSSDTATKALAVKRAQVMGQILPGIPVWKLGAESTHPDLMYVVFPGNVGGTDALTEAVSKFN